MSTPLTSSLSVIYCCYQLWDFNLRDYNLYYQTFAPRQIKRFSFFFHRNHMLGTLHFTGSKDCAPFHFSKRTALIS